MNVCDPLANDPADFSRTHDLRLAWIYCRWSRVIHPEAEQRFLDDDNCQSAWRVSSNDKSLAKSLVFIKLAASQQSRYASFMEVCESLVALNLIEHVGPVRVRQLLEHFGEAPAILSASHQQLLRVQGIGEDTAHAIASWEKTVDLKAEL